MLVEYIQQIKEKEDKEMERFTRQEAIGYMIIGLKETNLNEKEIKKIIHEVEISMDQWTEQYAEEEHDDFYRI